MQVKFELDIIWGEFLEYLPGVYNNEPFASSLEGIKFQLSKPLIVIEVFHVFDSASERALYTF